MIIIRILEARTDAYKGTGATTLGVPAWYQPILDKLAYRGR